MHVLGGLSVLAEDEPTHTGEAAEPLLDGVGAVGGVDAVEAASVVGGG
jgi:hypothetical protein